MRSFSPIFCLHTPGRYALNRDLNIVLSSYEKKGGVWDAAYRSMIYEKWSALNLLDVKYIGPIFTRSNLQEGGDNIRERLDSCVAHPD